MRVLMKFSSYPVTTIITNNRITEFRNIFDENLYERLAGRIVIEVENRGWYVESENEFPASEAAGLRQDTQPPGTRDEAPQRRGG